MSRRVLAPVLLLLAAACSIAAVFAVHRIESRGGPLSQPSATTFFSPDGNGVRDKAEVRFTTRQPERITIDVVTPDDSRVARLLDGTIVDGARTVEWDGRNADGETVPEGTYRFRITRAGDERTYSPTTTTVVDLTPPIGVLDRATLEFGKLRGLAMLGDGERLEAFDSNGDLVKASRQFRPNPDAYSAQPLGDAPEGTVATRFLFPLNATPDRIDVVDAAGNRRRVFPDPGVEYRANG